MAGMFSLFYFEMAGILMISYCLYYYFTCDKITLMISVILGGQKGLKFYHRTKQEIYIVVQEEIIVVHTVTHSNKIIGSTH